MITVNSVSGGMSSCMMALEFRADHSLFACVEQEAYWTTAEARRNRDPTGDVLRSQDWLRLFNPGFWASAEDDRTLIVMHKLSQELADYRHDRWRGGVEVVFAHNTGDSRYDTFDKIVESFLPNARKRICTEMLKVYPMYQYIKHYILYGSFDAPAREPVEMRIGYRLDELDRTVNLYFKLVEIKQRVPDPSFDLQQVINRYQIPDYLVKWWDRMDVEGMVRRGQRVLKPQPFNEYNGDYYRVPSFPLIEAGITKAEVVKYWSGKPDYVFPPISNCVMCFHHTIQQLQKQWAHPQNIAKMIWAANAENKKGRTFLKHYSMEQVRNLPIQTELEFSDFSGCDSGSCTD